MNNEFLKPYICTQCGGRVNRATLTCEMCGTTFKEDIPEQRIVVERPGVHFLRSQMAIDKEMYIALGATQASEYVIRRMANQMAEIIIPFMDVMTMEDPICHQTLIRSTVRVLEPKFRF